MRITIAEDKQLHLAGGVLAYLLALAPLALFDVQHAQPWALGAAALAGVLVEVAQAIENGIAARANKPRPHCIEAWDAVATAAGGLLAHCAVTGLTQLVAP